LLQHGLAMHSPIANAVPITRTQPAGKEQHDSKFLAR
jgi:hypothetical protein